MTWLTLRRERIWTAILTNKVKTLPEAIGEPGMGIVAEC